MSPASGSAGDDCLPPVLDAGAHHGPQDGMCVMEAVSVVAGLPWTDSPACTNPTLALAAQLINDALSDRTRACLVDLVPALSRAGGRDIDTDWRVVEAACHFAATGRTRRRSRTMNRWMWLAKRLDVAALRPPMAWLVRQGAARRAVEAAVVSVLTSRDADPETRSVEMLARLTSAAVSPGSQDGVAVPTREGVDQSRSRRRSRSTVSRQTPSSFAIRGRTARVR